MPRRCTATKCSRPRALLTSTADINDAGRGRTPASAPSHRTSRRPQPEQARIELLMRVSQVRILPGAPVKRPRTDHGLGPLTSTFSINAGGHPQPAAS